MLSSLRGEWRDGWYCIPHHVIYRDLDTFGHLNHSVFFTYFEWARALLWWEFTGNPGPREIGFIVAHASCDFRKQVGLEPVDICVRIGEMRNTSVDFLHEIRKRNGNDVAAAGKVTVVLFDWARQSKIAVPDELRRKVEEWSTAGF